MDNNTVQNLAMFLGFKQMLEASQKAGETDEQLVLVNQVITKLLKNLNKE